MDQAIHDFLTNYGLWAVAGLLLLSGVGLAVGEEMVTIPAGVFIAHGHMEFLPVAAVSYTCIVAADFMWFGLCRHYGMPLLHKRWLRRFVHPRRLLEVKHQFDRRGAWIIVMARFIPSSRTTTITVAGIMDMPFWQFAGPTAACVVLTVPLQLGLGCLVGLGLGVDRSLAELCLHLIGLVAVLVAAFMIFTLWKRHRLTRRRAPRARISWLRRIRARARGRDGAVIP